MSDGIDLMAELKKKLPQGAPVAWRWKISDPRYTGDWLYGTNPPRHCPADQFTVEPLYASELASSESGRPDWIWSLEQPEVSGVRWIETWDENALELGVRRFAVGDTLPPNVACWRYVEPPK